jgi:multiple sugar transport system substrate-binding protein
MVGVDYTRDLVQSLADEFNRRSTTVTLEIMWVPGPHYQSKLKTLIAAGQPPDLFYCGDVWVAYLRPFLRDVTDIMERDAAEMDLADFYPQLLEACKYQGRYYYLPRWFNISLLYYNRDLFRQAGVEFPTDKWTWDDYTSAGVALTRKGSDGKVETWGSLTDYLWWGEWLTLVRQSGGDMFNADVTRCTLDTPEAVRGMQYYFDTVYKFQFAPPPGKEPDNGFAGKKVAMQFGGHTGNWITYNAIPGLDWDVEVLPAGPVTRKGGELAIDALGISRMTKNPEAAWEVVKYFSSKHSIRRHVEKGYLSVRKSVAEETLRERKPDQKPRNIAAAYRALEYGTPLPSSPDFIELALEIIQPDIDDLLARRLDPAAVCRKVTDAANAYLKVVAGRRRTP